MHRLESVFINRGKLDVSESQSNDNDGDKPEKQRQTEFLSMPEDSQPMPVREPTGKTSQLGQGWRVILNVGDDKHPISVTDRVMIGRSVDNESSPDGIDFDLGPHSAYQFGVSRQHAVMTLRKGYLYLEDLGSTNGTRINGFQLTPHQKYRLRDGDEIEFARLRTTIRFFAPDDSSV